MSSGTGRVATVKAMYCLPSTRYVMGVPMASAGKSVYMLAGENLTTSGTLKGHAKPITALAFTPDGRRILTASKDETVRIWDIKSATETNAFEWRIGPVSAVAVAPDGQTCAAGGTQGRIVLWDMDL